MSSLSRRKTGGGLRSTLSLGRTGSLSNRPKDFYCTVFGQMDRSQTNLAVVLRTYFYPREEMLGSMVCFTRCAVDFYIASWLIPI